MNIEQALGSDWSYRLGWTVIHSLWQGSAAAALLTPALWGLRRRSPQVRYALAIATLGLMLFAAVVTLVIMQPPSVPSAPAEPPYAAATSGIEPSVIPSGIFKAEVQNNPRPSQPLLRVSGHAGISARDWTAAFGDRLLAGISRAWILGVLLLSIWRLGGWLAAQRLKVLGVQPAGPTLAAAFDRVRTRLGLARPGRVLQSVLARTPMVIGWLRPVVLVPVAMLANLTTEQLEAILAHELAHVRRYDYLINVLQVGVETLLFYHPAVWWMSRQIRLEREQCCDEIAIALCGDRCRYAESLAAIEEARLNSALALGARGSGGTQLLERIRRLLGLRDDMTPRSARGIAAAAVGMGAAIVAIVGLRLAGAPAVAQTTQTRSNAATAPAAAEQGVLLVTPGNYYLETALANISQRSSLSMTTVSPADFQSRRNQQVAPGQITVFDRWAPPETQPGPAIYVGIIPPGSPLADRDPAGHVVRVNDAGTVQWKHEHPTLRGLSLDKLYVASALKLRAAEHWETLASGTKGPLILARVDGGERQMVIGFDVLESNWPMNVSFPIFLRQSIQWLMKEDPAIDAAPARPTTRNAAAFRADCVLSAFSDGKREVLASPILNLDDGSETSFLFTGKPPVVIQQLPCREAGILGTVSVQQQSDGRLRVVCHISRRVGTQGEHVQDDDAALLEKSQSLAALQKRLIEARLLAEAARHESDFRRDKSGASTPYTAQEIARVDPGFAEKEKDLQTLWVHYQESRVTYGPNHPEVVATRQRIELWQKTIDEDVKKFNQSSLIVAQPDGQPGRIVSKDLSKLWAVVGECQRARDEESAAIKQILRVGGIQTDQTVRAGEPVAVELDDGTRLEVSVRAAVR